MSNRIMVDDLEVCAACLRDECEREACADRDEYGNINLGDDFKDGVVTVWHGVLLDRHDPKRFEEFFDDTLGAKIKFLETIRTKPDPGDSATGGRCDTFFVVEPKSIASFAVNRFSLESPPRWLDDVLDNEVHRHYLEDGTWRDIEGEDDCPLYPVRVVKYLREDSSNQ